jgi:hypothetical protein
VINKNLLVVLVRYFSLSIGIYIFILGSMYVLVEWIKIEKVLSYVVVYFCAYLAEYLLTVLMVFQTSHNWKKAMKFIIHTVSFLAMGTLLFRTMLYFQINYLIVTFAVAILLLPFRFLSNKYIVYR